MSIVYDFGNLPTKRLITEIAVRGVIGTNQRDKNIVGEDKSTMLKYQQCVQYLQQKCKESGNPPFCNVPSAKNRAVGRH
jgi:hypothetical protein